MAQEGGASQGPSATWRRLRRIDGVTESASSFEDRPALWVNGTEVVHEDAGGAYDVRLTRNVIRARRDRLRSDDRVRLRASSSSDWIEVQVASRADEDLLVELVRAAVAAHLPAPGTPPHRTPSGPQLERRRRLH